MPAIGAARWAVLAFWPQREVMSLHGPWRARYYADPFAKVIESYGGQAHVLWLVPATVTVSEFCSTMEVGDSGEHWYTPAGGHGL